METEGGPEEKECDGKSEAAIKGVEGIEELDEDRMEKTVECLVMKELVPALLIQKGVSESAAAAFAAEVAGEGDEMASVIMPPEMQTMEATFKALEDYLKTEGAGKNCDISKGQFLALRAGIDTYNTCVESVRSLPRIYTQITHLRLFEDAGRRHRREREVRRSSR